MLKIFHSSYKTVTAAAIMLSGASLISRLVGIVRDRVLAHNFGAGPIMDAYYTAFKVPDLIYNLLIVGAVTAGFIPTFTKLFQSDDKNPAWKLANNLLNILAIGLIVLCGIGALTVPYFAHFIAPGFTGENLARVINYTRIMFLSPLILGVSMITGGILQSLRRFTLYSFAPVFYNFGIIVGAVGLVPIIGDIGLAWGVILGAALHCALQIYGASHAGYRWKFWFDLKDANTRLMGKLMVPRTLGVAATQISQVAFTMIATLLPIGSVAVFNYANNLQGLPIGIIGIPFALAVFPLLSEAVAKNDDRQFIAYVSGTARKIILLIVPFTILFLLLRAQIVRVVLGSGSFDWTATISTADTLAFFALGMLAQSLIPLLARAFYALSDTKTPFIAGVIAELIGIIFALLLYKRLGTPGLALATTIAATLNLIFLTASFRHLAKGLEEKILLPMLFKTSVAGLIMAVVVQYLKTPLAKIFNQDYFWGIFGQGAVAGIVGVAVYALLCYILRIQEFVEIAGSLRKRFLKAENIPTSEGITLIE